MKKCFGVGALLLLICSLVACQEELSISSSSETSSVSSSSETSSSSTGSSSKQNNYSPIGPSTVVNLLTNNVTFSLSTNTISKEQAEELVNNDLSLYPEESSLHKKTTITSTKMESHVTENRSTATYSVKDIIEEKHTITQLDSDNMWFYSKSVENRTTSYFVEDTLYRHTIRENLYFVKDGCYYQVSAEQSYYEGMEDRGTFDAYYYKMPNLTEEDYIGRFTLHLESYTYFSGTNGLNKIDRTLYTNFTKSSSFYESGNYSSMERQPSYEFYSSGEKGNFGCVITDDYDYHLSDLNDYPSMEKNVLNTISYHQDYLLNISNYFTYEEDYMTKSVSKGNKDKVIRDETIQGRKRVTEECEVFYPNLSKFEEREYNPTTR